MLNKNEIANLALKRLGVSLTVSDLATDNSVQGKTIRSMFNTSMETLLEMHPWNFATKQAPLSLLMENPVPGYKYAYAYPADCLMIRQIACEGIFPKTNQYEHEKLRWEEVYGSQRTLHSNIKMAHAKYTVKISDETQMPTHFGRGLAAQLSMDIAPSIITNNFSKVSQLLNADAMRAINTSISMDLNQQPEKLDAASPFLRARDW